MLVCVVPMNRGDIINNPKRPYNTVLYQWGDVFSALVAPSNVLSSKETSKDLSSKLAGGISVCVQRLKTYKSHCLV